MYVGSFARVKTEGAPKQYPARCEYKDGGARDGVPTAKYLTSVVPDPRSAHTTRGHGGRSLTVALRDCLDPLWGVLACSSDGLVAPGFAGKVGLLHERLEPVAQEVIEAEDGVACVGVSNAVGYVHARRGTVGRKPVLDELVVEVEGAEYVGKEGQDLVASASCPCGLGGIRRDAGDGFRASGGVRPGYSVRVPFSHSSCRALNMSKDTNHRSYDKEKGVESGDPEVYAVEDAPDQVIAKRFGVFGLIKSGVEARGVERVPESQRP